MSREGFFISWLVAFEVYISYMCKLHILANKTTTLQPNFLLNIANHILKHNMKLHPIDKNSVRNSPYS